MAETWLRWVLGVGQLENTVMEGRWTYGRGMPVDSAEGSVGSMNRDWK